MPHRPCQQQLTRLSQPLLLLLLPLLCLRRGWCGTATPCCPWLWLLLLRDQLLQHFLLLMFLLLLVCQQLLLQYLLLLVLRALLLCYLLL